jgi:hypothetical protein
VRYAGRRTGAFLQRSENIIVMLDRALLSGASLKIDGTFEGIRIPWSPLLLGRSRTVRGAIEGSPILVRDNDPIWALRRELERAHLNRLNVRPQQVLRFLERQVPPKGESLAGSLRIDDVDDFLAFQTLRLAVPEVIAGVNESKLARHLVEHFEFVAAPEDLVDNLWVRSRGFLIRRKSDHVTLVDGHAF